MSYRLLLPLESSGKMEVTPQQSEILQKELFKIGYAWWASMQTKVKDTDMPYLYWDAYDKSISFSDKGCEAYFERQDNELHLFDNHFKIEE